jgi:hypothetical protein
MYDGAEPIGAVRRTWLAGHEVFGPSVAEPPTPRGSLLTRPI